MSAKGRLANLAFASKLDIGMVAESGPTDFGCRLASVRAPWLDAPLPGRS